MLNKENLAILTNLRASGDKVRHAAVNNQYLTINAEKCGEFKGATTVFEINNEAKSFK